MISLKNSFRIIGILLLIGLFAISPPREFWSISKNIKVGYVAVAVLTNLILVCLKSFRWRNLLRATNINYPFFDSYLCYWSGIVFGIATPGRLGEYGRIALASRDLHLCYSSLFPSVVADRVFDFLITAIFALAGLLYLPIISQTVKFKIIFFISLVIFALYIANKFEYINRFSSLKIFEGLRKNKFFQNIRIWISSTKFNTIAKAFLISAIAYFVYLFQCYLISISINTGATFINVAIAVSIGSLVASLPVSIAGIGTRDAAIITILGYSGISRQSAFTFSLLFFAVFYLIGSVIGGVALLIKLFKLKKSISKQSYGN